MKNNAVFILHCLGIFVCLAFQAAAQSLPQSLPDIKYHLAPPDWKPLGTPRGHYLDAVKGMVSVARKFQNDEGAIVDPFLHREHQYATPYYAFAVGTLVNTGHSAEMLSSGVRAMEKALTDFSNGRDSIPDQHGEFYIAALAGAMDLYKDHIPKEKYDRWKEMVSVPLDHVWDGPASHLNNWRTYAMKGEWKRAAHGFADKPKIIDFIENNWKYATQYERMGTTDWNLYEDWSSDPQSLAVEAVGRGNLTALAMEGYNGPSADQLKAAVRKGGAAAMLLMSPTGQCPPNGRTDNHVFNDILYQLIFEALAEDAHQRNETYLAGQFRRSALLAFQSMARWKRRDTEWKDSYSIVKNHYDLTDRTGYQPASQWGNYSGAMMFHLAEAFLTRRSDIPEVPSPAEIGGYAIETGNRFSTFTANAGGMQVVINLRGASVPKYGMYWTPLGGVRFSKMGWDDRLGPSDGKRLDPSDAAGSLSSGQGHSDGVFPQTGLTFGPTWEHKGQWVRIADMATHYRGTVATEFVHPLLVKFSITYASITGVGGPTFRQDFVVTPDGVMTYLTSPQNVPFGVTVPLLADDGRPLEVQVANGVASTKFTNGNDIQNFIGLGQGVEGIRDGTGIKSTYGLLLPVTFRSKEHRQMVFVYPKSPSNPDAENVKESFSLSEDGFSSMLGRVEGTLYVGKKMAGGYGKTLDLDQDGEAELMLDRPCGFVVQLLKGKISKIEVDTDVDLTVNGRRLSLKAYSPFDLRQ